MAIYREWWDSAKTDQITASLPESGQAGNSITTIDVWLFNDKAAAHADTSTMSGWYLVLEQFDAVSSSWVRSGPAALEELWCKAAITAIDNTGDAGMIAQTVAATPLGRGRSILLSPIPKGCGRKLAITIEIPPGAGNQSPKLRFAFDTATGVASGELPVVTSSQSLASIADPTVQTWAGVGMALGTNTFTALDRILYFKRTNNTSANNWAGQFMAAPATPYTVTVVMKASVLMTLDSADRLAFAGFGWYESASGKLDGVLGNFIRSGGTRRSVYFERTWWTSTTSRAGNTGLQDIGASLNEVWTFRFSDDGTTRKVEFSSNGRDFATLFSTPRATNFTTAPDQIGIVLATWSLAAVDAVEMTVYGWKIS